MDYLWTPWRYRYVTAPGDVGECIFCAAARHDDDRATLIAYRGERCFVMLNRYPYTNGHVMVAPYGHVGDLEQLSGDTAAEMIRTAQQCVGHLKAMYNPDGLNLGMNLGKSAGAGVADHLHLHVLPRWTGDTSFMTTVAETRVMPEALEVTWERLRAAMRGA